MHPKIPPKRRYRPSKPVKTLKIKPGADSRLKKVFSKIGVPEQTDFIPDPFQLEALKAISRGDCLVTAPTGSGKTWIAEQAIREVIQRGGRAWYASPLKALSNAIYLAFSDIFGPENLGILTGDRKENPDAHIIVGTTEILRNQLYDAMYEGKTLNSEFVVLDEAHFLGDEDRGVVWEEIMIYLPVRIPLLMLSATIGNAYEIAAWLSSMRDRKCYVIEEKTRPVPLYPLFFHPSGMILPLLSMRKPDRKKKGLSKKVASFVRSKTSPVLAPPGRLPPFGKILRVLRKYRLLPAIFFLKSRADCDQALILSKENVILHPERKEKLGRRIETLSESVPHIKNHRQMQELEHLALGAHHSGQLPSWKIVLETLMSEGLLDAVFATSTVAAGVNFPARTVVFLNSDRFNGHEFVPLSSTDLTQMTGRAGRRGKDQIGFAVALPGKFMDIPLIAELVNSPPAPIHSQIKITFSMVLNLLLSHKPDEIEHLLEKSFATYRISRARKKKRGKASQNDEAKYLWKDFLHHLNFLKETGYVTNEGTLTEDGHWASHLRIDQPLMIAEGFRLGIFPHSNPALMAAVTALFVNERESDNRFDRSELPHSLVSTYYRIRSGLIPFAKYMIHSGFSVRPIFLRPALTLFEWTKGLPWERVLKKSELAEGDLAMLILRTADNLRHIQSLSKVFPKAASTAGQAVEMILREPLVTYFSA
jgi:superfamily II RNA helicase